VKIKIAKTNSALIASAILSKRTVIRVSLCGKVTIQSYDNKMCKNERREDDDVEADDDERRDWLALSMATDEPRAAIEKFVRKEEA